MDKSYVTLEQHVCDVCGKHYDTGNILMDQRLRQRFEHNTVTGYGLCPEHQNLYNDGFIALVELDTAKSKIGATQKIVSREQAYRTGRLAHIRSSVWKNVFGCEPPTGPVAFIEPGVIERLQALPVASAEEPA